MQNNKNINELNKSLRKLSKSLDDIKTRKKKLKNESSKNNNYKNFSHAFRIVSELFANVIVGAFIGLGLDYFFGTKPILLIIFLIIGMISGIYTSYRSALNWQK